MAPGVGELDVFPSIWGRKYKDPSLNIGLDHRLTGFFLA